MVNSVLKPARGGLALAQVRILSPNIPKTLPRPEEVSQARLRFRV